MKKFILLIVLVLFSCSSDRPDSKAGSLVTKFDLVYHHTENCTGHQLRCQKIDCQVDGHDMWCFAVNGGYDWQFVHSPDCRKCKGEEPSDISKKSIFDW